MAECVGCGKYLGFFDEKHRLTDGKCCPSCWFKACAFNIKKDEISSDDILSRMESMDAIQMAHKKVETFHKQKCKELGLNPDELAFGSLINNECYHFGVHNGVLYQIEWDYNYNERYDVQHTMKTKQDVERLVAKELIYKTIPVENIQYFAKDGDVKYTTKISGGGGGGGGSSITGAIVGGLVAGEAGAIIGSRQKINPITSTTETHSTTQTILKYFDGESLVVLTFRRHDMYNYLLAKIPEKELSSVQLQQTSSNATSSNDIKQKLKVLKGLFEEGLITESEYNEKKQELLTNI